MASSLSMEELCNRLRSMVHDCLSKHLYDSAIFYADKLTTMSNQAPRDAYLLAQVRLLNKISQAILVNVPPQGATRLPNKSQTQPVAPGHLLLESTLIC